jgi:hypothetical protein
MTLKNLRKMTRQKKNQTIRLAKEKNAEFGGEIIGPAIQPLPRPAGCPLRATQIFPHRILAEACR